LGEGSQTFSRSGATSQGCEDLFILGEAALLFLGEDEVVVQADLEGPLGAGNELDRAQSVLKLSEDRVRQTDGLGTIVSGGAELDSNSHERSSYPPLPKPLVYLATLNRLKARVLEKARTQGGIVTATLIIIIGVIALLVIIGIFMYNRLVQLRNRVEAGWSQIDVQLKRRYDLIPNLVETVKGYAAHERETLEAVVAARQQAVSANGVEEQAQAENMLTGALRQLFAVAEAYPDLKANQNFLALQEELTGTEGRIAYARQFYNDQVLQYDNAREQFPSSIFAGAFNFEEAAYFEVEEAASREPVKVDFGQGDGTPQQAPPTQAPPAQQPPPQ